MKLDFWQRLSRLVMVVVTPVSVTLLSCGPVQPPPAQNDGPAFAITSPQDGVQVAGPVFFSVQPLNPDEVSGVVFEAGGTRLEPDSPGEDAFRVFLLPADFADGALELVATVTGQDGKQRRQSLTVTVVANPPESATVDADGAVLGTTEESGALSTLSVPPGAAEGATVTFESRTKDEVKAETGIDYDALGVTFLGAQEINSTATLDTPLAVSSGGFGPMVQPGQAVLNYMIAPDGDGDGIGELVAVNTASVAPNGDVISDPVPQLQLGAASSTDSSGSQPLRSLQAGTISGPPGTFIELEATGFNQFSAFGNVAIVESLVDGTELELPAFVNNHYEDENPIPTIGFYIPPLPAGAATLTLKNVGSSQTTAPIGVTVEAAPALTEEPAVIIDEMLADMIAALSEEPEVQDGVSQLEEARSTFAELSNNPTPEEARALTDIAVFISNSNIADVLNRLEAARSSNLSTLQQCNMAGLEFFTDLTVGGGFSLVIGAVLLGLAVSTAPVSIPLVYSAGLLVGGGSVFFGAGVVGLLKLGSECLIPPPQTCLPPYKNTDLAPFLPQGIRAQQTSSPFVTGMGSVIPPGGDSCGSAVGGDTGASLRLQNRGLQNQSTGLEDLFGDLAGRFVVKVFYGGGNVVPFTGVSDSSGYFYIPLIPAGQPFEAVAIDTLTNETRSFEGTGPEVGQSTYLFFDFLSEDEGGATVLEYDSNTQGVHDGTDIYFFEGKDGDRINLAVFSEEVNVGGIDFQLSDPNGLPLMTGRALGGHYFETRILELFANGLYTFVLDGSEASGNYTLGLSEIAPATPIDPSVPLEGDLTALGDTHFYTFTGNTDDTLDVTLSHDSGSSLNAALSVRDPAFGEAGLILNLVTDDTRRSATTGPATLPIDGEYVLQLSLADDFDDELAKHLGSYQIDLSLTP